MEPRLIIVLLTVVLLPVAAYADRVAVDAVMIRMALAGAGEHRAEIVAALLKFRLTRASRWWLTHRAI
jgi:hypothetical protein